MLWYTHLMAGAATGLIAGSHIGARGILTAAAVSGFASLIPDIDSPKSVLGRSLPIFSWGAKLTVGHRGVLHSLLAAVAASWLLTFVPVLSHHSWCFFLGYVSHLVLDTLNPEGVPLFWPLTLRVSLPLAETGGFFEKLVLRPLLAVVFCLAVIVNLF